MAIFIADVDHADILNPILREKGIRSLLGVPLIVEGDLIGVLHVGSLTPRTFGRARSGRPAGRGGAGGAGHRARAPVLGAGARAPGGDGPAAQPAAQAPRRVVGVTTAARYLPATDEVGGDWYDVFELPRGRLGMAIGDVVGHGVARRR